MGSTIELALAKPVTWKKGEEMRVRKISVSNGPRPMAEPPRDCNLQSLTIIDAVSNNEGYLFSVEGTGVSPFNVSRSYAHLERGI